jgi:hypothetical protein
MDPSTITSTSVTHAETAWLVDVVPLAMVAALVLLFTLLLQGRLRTALHSYLLRRFNRAANEQLQPALLYHPPIIGAGQLLLICLCAVLLVLLVLARLGPLFVAALLAGPVTALLIWLFLWLKEQSYISALDGSLPAAVGRLEAQLRSGSGIQAAIEKVLLDLPPSPLRSEWAWFIEHLGVPLGARTLATAPVVCSALLAQTPSRRHASFLAHLETALDQPHSALVRRMGAAAEALQAAQRRRSTAVTALAQMRNSGVVLFLAALTISIYLIAVQRERVVRAFEGDLGFVIGLIFVAAITAPLVAGHLLARVDDLDY